MDQVYKDPALLNLDAVSLKSGFSRRQIIEFYTLYKTLTKLTVIQSNGDMSKPRGVNLKLFREGMLFNIKIIIIHTKGIPQLSLENKELVKKIFKKADTSHTGYLSWDEFLESMKIIFTDSLELTIELFFDIIDSDGNGFLDYDEVREI